MKAAVMHLLVALVWLFLNGSGTLGSFLVGLAAGFLLLALFQRALGCESYVRRIGAFVVFLFRLLVDIVHSNLRIARLVLSPQANSIPGRFVCYDVRDLTKIEIILMSQCLSLTPGTTVADLDERGQLILHTFPALSDEELKDMVDRTVRQPLLAFTR